MDHASNIGRRIDVTAGRFVAPSLDPEGVAAFAAQFGRDGASGPPNQQALFVFVLGLSHHSHAHLRGGESGADKKR